MITIQLVQKNKEVAIMIKNLMTNSATNLTKVCEEHSLDYRLTYKKINSRRVDIQFLADLVEQINPKSTFIYNFEIGLSLNDSIIFNQKTKK